VHVIRLESAPARRVADAIREAYAEKANQANQPFSLRVDPVGNTLVVASTAAMFEQIEATARELDALAPGGGKAIFVIDLEHVSPEEAARNRYYGFDGWLLAFYATFAASVLSSTIFAFDSIYLQSLQDSYGLAPVGATTLSVVMMIWSVALLSVVPMRRPLVPKLLVAGIWLYGFIHWTIVLVFGAPEPMSFVGLGTSIAYSSLFSWYWLKSKRVNVSYLNRVPAT